MGDIQGWKGSESQHGGGGEGDDGGDIDNGVNRDPDGDKNIGPAGR